MKRALAALLCAGCGTYGVDVVERQVKSSHPADGIATVAAAISVEDEVRVEGGGQAIDGTLGLVAWLEPGASAELLDRVELAMERRGAQLEIRPDQTGAPTEQIVLTDLELVLAEELGIDLDVSHGEVAVAGVSGPVRIAAGGSVDLDRTGPVDVAAEEVTAVLGAGGRIATEAGGVTVTVLGDDFEQLLVTTDTGPVAVHLPPGGGWNIELSTAGEALATVNLGGLSCGGAGGDPCTSVVFGAGGPLIRVESNGGAIAVDDLR